jgi:glyoxylase-like metal-dependent hydrolase (beta-lactamase superfamily II)
VFAQKLNDSLYIIDLKPLGLENHIASYVLKGSDSTAIIETGPTCSIPNLLKGLREIGVKNKDVDYVLVSHVHIDHAGGAGTLMRHLPSAKLIVHSRGAPHMVKPEKLWEASKQVLGEIAIAYREIEPVPTNRVATPVDGTVIDLGGSVQLKVLETLGHASHHLGFFENMSRGIFQGDAAGIYIPKLDVAIPTTPAPFNLEMTLSSIQKILDMAPNWLYYTHFGPVNNAENRLKAYAAQLKLWEKTVSEALDESGNLQVMYEKILENDPQMRVAAEHIKNHMFLRRGVVMQNIQGFVEYLRKKRIS